MRIFYFIKNRTFIYFVCGFKGILFYFSFLWFIFYQVFEMTKHTDWTLVNIWLVIQCFTIKLKLAAGRVRGRASSEGSRRFHYHGEGLYRWGALRIYAN